MSTVVSMAFLVALAFTVHSAIVDQETGIEVVSVECHLASLLLILFAVIVTSPDGLVHL